MTGEEIVDELVACGVPVKEWQVYKHRDEGQKWPDPRVLVNDRFEIFSAPIPGKSLSMKNQNFDPDRLWWKDRAEAEDIERSEGGLDHLAIEILGRI